MSMYRKVRKLIKSPRMFFYDMIEKNNNVLKKDLNKKNKSKNNICIDKKKNIKSDYPDVFNMYNEKPLINNEMLNNDKVFVYIPWIEGQGNVLIRQIGDGDTYKIKELNLFLCSNGKDRKDIMEFVRNEPELYKGFLRSKFLLIKDKIYGLIVTLDWTPVMHLAVDVCHELGIYTILIPHESVFLDEQKYYWDPKSFSSIPNCDIVLGWGELQKRIFTERGYPEDRFFIVGSPKMDACSHYKPILSRKQFCNLYGLKEEFPIFLFASQFLDNQIDRKEALKAQREAINDILDYCDEHKCQLILRQPPNGSNILDSLLKKRICDSDYAVVDDGICYITPPVESIYHSDFVFSINSTMLFEACIMKKNIISIRYIDINSIWTGDVIPYVKDKNELFKMIDDMKSDRNFVNEKEFNILKKEFGVGEFDGKSVIRIHEKLKDIVLGNINCSLPSVINCLINNKVIDVVKIPTSKEISISIQYHFKELIKARTLLSKEYSKKENLLAVNLFVQWGLLNNTSKIQQRQFAQQMGIPVIYCEDGFIRSYHIGLSGEPGLSIIVDDLTCYYDATKASRLETFLNSEEKLSDENREYCKMIIDNIVKNKISKYNDAPRIELKIGREGKKKILLVDQRFGDMSVSCGLANEKTFDRMLYDVIQNYSDYDIIIKQHPDAIKGGKSSYFNNNKLAFSKHMPNIFVVDYDINPYCLLENIDEVFVCTSQLGFEALMTGKKVHCYGMPFYAGWGCTEDKIRIDRRTRKRDVIEIFYFSYIRMSRYINPETGKQGNIEDVINYLKDKIYK